METLKSILLATRNQGKLKELQGLFAHTPVTIQGLQDFENVPADVEETGTTFRANATLKAVEYGKAAGTITLADDSGLEVDALQGAPGVYSARFSGEGATDAKNNALLLKKLQDLPEAPRSARFRCSLALYIPASPLAQKVRGCAQGSPVVDIAENTGDDLVLLLDGSTEGTIIDEIRGDGGFGYDPLFLSKDLGVTFAEAGAEKQQVSHRGRAFRTLVTWLTEQGLLSQS